jgi:hypothetical protein
MQAFLHPASRCRAHIDKSIRPAFALIGALCLRELHSAFALLWCSKNEQTLLTGSNTSGTFGVIAQMTLNARPSDAPYSIELKDIETTDPDDTSGAPSSYVDTTHDLDKVTYPL